MARGGYAGRHAALPLAAFLLAPPTHRTPPTPDTHHRYGKASSSQGKAAAKEKVEAAEPLAAGKGRDLIGALNDKIESE